MSKQKYFNLVGKSANFYVYGTIVNEKEPDFWTGELSKTEVDPQEFKEELDEIADKGITDINIFINSGGGSVFASSTIVSLLKRHKENTRAKIHSFIDGLCASAATYLCMVADDINIYQNSIMMIHKPISMAWGNSNELQKEIDTLNNIECNMMIPMYMSKGKCTEDEMRELINNETWFNGNENDKLYIGNFFDVNLLEESKEIVASVSQDLFKNYKHVPENLKSILKDENRKNERVIDNKNNIDYSFFEKKLKLVKGE